MDPQNQMENRILPYRMLLEALSSTHELVERILPKNGMPSLKIGLEKMISALTDNFEKAKRGLPIVGYHFSLPAEYLKCYDCVPVCLEGVGYFLSTLLLYGIEKYYDLIGSWGHPFHTCSAQKGSMGMSLDNLFKFDAIITPTAPCDSTCASYPFFKHKEKFPLVIADMPFSFDEKGYKYYAEQLKISLIELGKVIGQEPDFERLKKAIEIENKALQVKMELFELIKAIPSPIENMFNAISAATSIMIPGTMENLSFYQEMLKIAKERYKEKIHHGSEEKIRSIWPYMISFFDISLLEWLDREIGMSVLLDIFNYNFSDPVDISNLDKMFYLMARKGMNWPMVKQSVEFYYPFIDDCVRMAKDFSADCFIFTQSLACKQFGSVGQILREALRDEIGIPMLIIDFDVGDARMTSLKTMKEKIKTFVQTLL
jgi:benzoyl-CoA reductase/2-hydroxyglutaryl-CoA dehydratase subunit BcrC/BadD/HgdB